VDVSVDATGLRPGVYAALAYFAVNAVLVDVALDEKLLRSLRNIPGVVLVASARVTARDVMNAGRVVATKAALEKLQEALA
jgi:ribosomal protein L4